ncbi:MAG: ATP-binding protein [Desulfococcaceae bacterium]
MPEILVISGKGGTGKTSLTAAFAHIASDHVICDLDVDAPDLHLILRPEQTVSHDFFSGYGASVIRDKCESCGICAEMCRFGAVSGSPVPEINPLKCEGCKVCVSFCPADAIAFEEKHCGQWYLSETRFGPMVHARLFPGEENSGKLVTLLKQQAQKLAKEKGRSLILSDGTPGIGCPVISSLSGTSLVVAVTEPTPSGLHDLERVIELCGYFRVPAGVIVNKSDLNENISRKIRDFCREKGLTLLGYLPYDPVVTKAMVMAQAITEYCNNGFSDTIRNIWAAILKMLADENMKQKTG